MQNVYRADFLELQVDSYLRREQLMQKDQRPEEIKRTNAQHRILHKDKTTEILPADSDRKPVSGSATNTNELKTNPCEIPHRNNASCALQQNKDSCFPENNGRNEPNTDPCGRPHETTDWLPQETSKESDTAKEVFANPCRRPQENKAILEDETHQNTYVANEKSMKGTRNDPCGMPHGDNVLSTEDDVTDINTGTKLVNDSTNIENSLTGYLTDPITTLPVNYFDTIVFSLLLSYLPTPKQRWDCCVKANELLRQNGLLILIESDSAHQNRNAHQIRAWKEALTGIGFVRYKYEKLAHLHCMAFRKVNDIKDHICDVNGVIDNSEMMFIPQDFHDEEEEITKSEDRSETQDFEMAELMMILPNC